MTTWQLCRQDDNGNRYLIATYGDRVAAMAQALIFESGYQHRQLYEVLGPRGPVVVTNRDLYLRILWLGEEMKTSGRTLSEYLRALWLVSRPLANRAQLEPDTVAAMLTAAVEAPPPPMNPAWRTADLSDADSRATGYADFERIIMAQVADLADFDDRPLSSYAYFGIDAPRPPNVFRSTDSRWYNFDPHTYLECAMAATFGGWDPADGLRVSLTAEADERLPEPEEYLVDLPLISWAGLADFAECGQTYE